MYSVLLLVLLIVSLSGFTEAELSNPVVNVNSGRGDSNTSDVKVSTELQLDQAKELFKEVAKQLLDEYEKRLVTIVSKLEKTCRPKDCQDVYDLVSTHSGIYTIYPDDTRGFSVRCDMDTTSGGWTVIQRRVSDTDFYKPWSDYETGFGDLSENFWLGNQQIHALTSRWRYELRIDMTLSEGMTAYAQYETFRIGDAASSYELFVDGYNGNAGDSLNIHNGCKFSTHDRDNDDSSFNCAVLYHGAWWYADCHESNLNGHYGNEDYAKGLTWASFSTFYKSLMKTEMKIRRFEQPSVSVGNG